MNKQTTLLGGLGASLPIRIRVSLELDLNDPNQKHKIYYKRKHTSPALFTKNPDLKKDGQ